MFSILFFQDSSLRLNNIQGGEIIIGEFKELFFSSLSYWNEEQYLKQWEEGIRRIYEGKSNSALVVDMYDLNSQNIIQWWVFHLRKDTAFVRNEIILLDKLKKPLSEENIYDQIEEKSKRNRKNQEISEWQISINEICNFYEKIFC